MPKKKVCVNTQSLLIKKGWVINKEKSRIFINKHHRHISLRNLVDKNVSENFSSDTRCNFRKNNGRPLKDALTNFRDKFSNFF